MKSFCSKCGYNGEKTIPHLAPKGSGRFCNYEPMELEPISEEKAREILMQYGWDLRDSQEGRAGE